MEEEEEEAMNIVFKSEKRTFGTACTFMYA
jgi:hypothetical protein